ncbi:MAG: hypothetical protein M5U19_11925 [Microthrixaceae bacterium]|nr:hypothetical protein [Microthrixaceae bacterium]
MIERYLLEREQLTMVALLVDGEVGPTGLDLGMLEWARHNRVPHSVIATKHDKVRPSDRTSAAGSSQHAMTSRCETSCG